MADDAKRSSAKGRQAGDYQPPILTKPRGGPIKRGYQPKAKVAAAMAPPRRDREPTAADVATAGLLAQWPDLSAALAAALVGLVGGATPAKLATLTVPTVVVEDLAAAVGQAMTGAALDAAATTVADAHDQGVRLRPPAPDHDRIAEVAAVTAALIAGAYTTAATRKALQVGPDAAATAVAALLAAMGAAPTGLVADQLGAAILAAQHTGRLAVFAAYPPTQLVADESHDTSGSRCPACADINGNIYRDLESALADYPTAGYARCAGGLRCRGQLRAIWSAGPVAAAKPDPDRQLVTDLVTAAADSKWNQLDPLDQKLTTREKVHGWQAGPTPAEHWQSSPEVDQLAYHLDIALLTAPDIATALGRLFREGAPASEANKAILARGYDLYLAERDLTHTTDPAMSVDDFRQKVADIAGVK